MDTNYPDFETTGDDAPHDAEPVTGAEPSPKNDPVPEDTTTEVQP